MRSPASTLQRVLSLLAAFLVVATLVAPGAVASPPQEQDEPLQQGFELLMDRFVHPVDSDLLLSAAWHAALAEFDRNGLSLPDVPSPTFTGERESDWLAFHARWLELVGATASRPDPAALTRASLHGMARSLAEGHTVYMAPELYADHLAWSRGELRYAGIGARIAGPEPTIIEVFADSPADRAGLRPGDVITHLDDWPVVGLPLGEVVSRVRGPDGSELTLTLVRDGDEGPLLVPMVRAEIQLAMVESRMLPDRVAYVRLRGFPEPSVVDEFHRSMADLQDQGAEALVLDLRGNAGGRLDVGRRLLRLLVRDGPLYQQITRAGNAETAFVRPSDLLLELPLAVLVDGGTASMGEITAAAIQEHGLGWIVGETTAGNVAAAQVFPLGDGSAVQVTIMEIRSGYGQPLNGVGVTPDVLVANSLAELARGYDAQLSAALQLLAREGMPARFGPARGFCASLPCAA